MFVIEYRTKSAERVYPSDFINVGSHKAQSIEAAIAFAQNRLGPNVEILSAHVVSYD
jgi:hypothetical protein